MDRLQAMAILLRAVDRGTFSAVARETRMPLPTVSRKVSELEAHVGAKLLVRTTRKLALTDAGIAYVAAARRILEQVDDAERQAAGEFNSPKGELIVTAPLAFGRIHMIPIIAEFLASYPDIDIQLMLSDRNVQLLDDHVDMALRIGQLPDSSFVATRLGWMRTVVCVSPRLLAGHGIPARPQGLETFPLVSFDPLQSKARWTFREPSSGREFGVDISPRLTPSTADAALAAAAAGIGATRLLHYQCEKEVSDGSLEIILSDFELDPLPVSMLHQPRNSLPLKTRVFLDFSVDRLKGRIRLLDPR